MSDGKTPRPVYLRLLAPSDAPALLQFHHENRDFHLPFTMPPLTFEGVSEYIEQSGGDNFRRFLVLDHAADELVGVVSLSQIFWRAFQNAYLGYYGSARFAGQGRMTSGVRQAITYAFHTLGLHRLEANIQPENRASLALVRRLGFVKEGFSRRYLNIGGEWRDHERWAATVEDWHPENRALSPSL